MGSNDKNRLPNFLHCLRVFGLSIGNTPEFPKSTKNLKESSAPWSLKRKDIDPNHPPRENTDLLGDYSSTKGQ